MKVAIIGAGNVGKALAKSSIRGGHTVTMSAAHPENAWRC
jgi:predicted dinucleotide-binding enzyme